MKKVITLCLFVLMAMTASAQKFALVDMDYIVHPLLVVGIVVPELVVVAFDLVVVDLVAHNKQPSALVYKS